MKKMVKKKKGTKKTRKMRKGTKYTCRECGLVVTIDEVCGCVDFCDLMCCGKQMVRKTPG
jgi:hypothetical protein